MVSRCGARFVVGALAVAAALTAGCGDDSEANGGSPTTVDPTTTVDDGPTTSTTEPEETTDRAEAEVVAAYEGAIQAFIDAAAVPDPESSAVIETHVDPMLEVRLSTLRALQLDGRAIRYPADSQYRNAVTSVEFPAEDTALLIVCNVDDGERVDVATGEVIGGGVVTVEWRAGMRLVDGTWRLAERVEEARSDGVSGCAVE